MGTVYTGKYNNHSIRIDNSLLKCKLFIDGEEKDKVQGLFIRDDSNKLRSVIKEGDGEVPVEVLLDAILIKRGVLHNETGVRYVVKVGGEFFATGLIKSGQQKKYGAFMQMSSDAARTSNKG